LSRWIFVALTTAFWMVVATAAFNMAPETTALSALLLLGALVTGLDVLAPQQQQQRQSAPTHRP
jgi:hypothetical protein